MSLRKLPEAKAFERPAGLEWDAPSDVLARWEPMAAEADDPATISLYDVIGEDWYSGDGWTAKRMAGALRAIGKKDVAVNINSPGGDMFEGLAIYNLLREHPAKVTVKVMGIAASAASIIAMAGDEIQMGGGTFLMIHNAWGIVIGNRNDMRDAADIFEKFDASMADIYAARTGKKVADIAALMDAETYIAAREAVEGGFADSVSDMKDAAASLRSRPELSAKRRVDALLAKQGVPRTERRSLIRNLSGTHDAADPATLRAGEDLTASLRSLLTTLS